VSVVERIRESASGTIDHENGDKAISLIPILTLVYPHPA